MRADEQGSLFDRYHLDYDAALSRGLWIAGEERDYFAKSRIAFLAKCLAERKQRPVEVIDLGCGTGDSSPLLLGALGARRVLGIDVSEKSLEVARRQQAHRGVEFLSAEDYRAGASASLVYCNGVLHHVAPEDRQAFLAKIRATLSPGGLLSLWENNAWNPGTRWIMRRIPFDRDAHPISAVAAARLLRHAGFEILSKDHLFIFPRAFRALRFLEPLLRKVPIGAQYQLLAVRHDAERAA